MPRDRPARPQEDSLASEMDKSRKPQQDKPGSGKGMSPPPPKPGEQQDQQHGQKGQQGGKPPMKPQQG